MKEKIKIFEYFMEKVLTKGIKSVTMDELAKEMSISKKTIYKHFPSKEVIINLVFRIITKRVTKEFTKIIESDNNAIIKYLNLTQFILQNIQRVSAGNLRYLKFQNPDLWNKIDSFRTKTINKNIRILIEQGKKEGLISTIDTNIMLQCYLASIRTIINPDFLITHSISAKEAGESVVYLIFKGILTEKGWDLFEKYKKETENEKNNIR